MARPRRKQSIFEVEEADSREFLETLLTAGREQLLALNDDDLAALTWRAEWMAVARENQLPPPGDWGTWMVLAGRGFGKALALDTPVPTPGGWTSMRAVQVGDKVFDENGRECTVTYVSPIWFGRRCYRLRFSDGAEIVADEDHEWLTVDRRTRKALRRRVLAPKRQDRPQCVARIAPSVVTTGHIAATLMDGKEINHAVPVAQPLCLPAQPLLVDPWVLGLWLGDGESNGNGISVGEQDVAETRQLLEAAGVDTRMRNTDPGKAPMIGMLGVWPALKALGVNGNKHIPALYLRGSREQRIALLQGLMDSDGTAALNGTCEFTSVDLHLATQVCELACSLGLKPTLLQSRATISGQYICQNYRVHFTAYWPVFRLARKAARQRPPMAQAARQRRRYIVACDEIPSVPVRCIQVDSPSHLFLAGDRMIPTHNTRLGTEDIGWYGYTHPNTRIAIVGRTAADVRDTCFEGVSGLVNVVPGILVKDYHRSLNELVLKNGSRFKGYSAEEPDKLRGPQFHRALCDEMASWANAEETWDMLQFGLRLGDQPRTIITTTPKPVDLVRRLSADPTVSITRGSTYDNRENLAATFFDQIAQYEGTEIGRQEIHGELIDPEEHGIFKRSWFRLWPAAKPFPKFEYIVMSLDTAFTEKTLNDPTACTIWGVFKGQDTDVHGWNVMLCDAWSGHLTYAALRKRAEDEYRSLYGEPGRFPDVVLIENKGSGITLCQDLRLAGVPVRPYNPGHADKVQRAHRISYLVANGLCWLPESTLKSGRPRDWCEDMLTQICTFPLSKRFDYVDTFTQALHLLADQSWLRLEKAVVEYDDDEGPRRRSNPYAA